MTSANLNSKKSLEFLTKGRPLLLRLAVVSRVGNQIHPHVSSVWYLWREGYFWVSTAEDRLKVRAIRSNSRVALIIDNDAPPYRGIIVEGIAILTKERLREITLEIVERYVREKDVQKQFQDLMKYKRILIKIRPVKSIDIMSYRRAFKQNH